VYFTFNMFGYTYMLCHNENSYMPIMRFTAPSHLADCKVTSSISFDLFLQIIWAQLRLKSYCCNWFQTSSLVYRVYYFLNGFTPCSHITVSQRNSTNKMTQLLRFVNGCSHIIPVHTLLHHTPVTANICHLC